MFPESGLIDMTPQLKPHWTIESDSPEATRELARRLGRALRGGEVILLRGELGAGKTLFAGGLAEGMGIGEPAVSPTFIIMRSYRAPGGIELHHYDFYRIRGAEDLETLGVEESQGPGVVALIEWPERAPEAFPEWTVDLTITATGEESRRIEGSWGSLSSGFDRTAWPG